MHLSKPTGLYNTKPELQYAQIFKNLWGGRVIPRQKAYVTRESKVLKIHT